MGTFTDLCDRRQRQRVSTMTTIAASAGNDERSIADWLGMSRYYDMLGEGSTGSYREMLKT